jgi:hypothetical protein
VVRLPIFLAVVLAAAAPSISAAQDARPASPSVSGPAVSRAGAVDEESVYRLLRQQLTLLVEAQDRARENSGEYARQFGQGLRALAFSPPAGVTIALEHANPVGWVATAQHASLAGKNCVIWVGMVRPERRPVTRHDQNSGNEAEIVCDLVP